MTQSAVELSVILFPVSGAQDASQPAWGMRSLVQVEPSSALLLDRQTAESLPAIPVRRQGKILTVAMPDPGDRRTIAVAVQKTGLRVRPVQADAKDIRRALELIYEGQGASGDRPLRRQVGWLLVERGHITSEQLELAVEAQRRSGDRLGRVLVAMGLINRLMLAEVLAEQFELPLVNIRQEVPPLAVVRLLDRDLARRLGSVPVRWLGSQLLVAMTDPGDTAAQAELRQALDAPLVFGVTSELDIDWILSVAHRSFYLEESISGLLYRDPEESAYVPFTDVQLAVALAGVLLAIAGMILAPLATMVVITALASVLYFIVSLYRLWLAFRGAYVNVTIAVSDEELAQLKDSSLPIYTILVPLYHEKEVLSQLFEAIQNLDYPKAKLDVKLLLEEDDLDTIAAAKNFRPPGYFQFVIVPAAPPRTKPKACNYGMVTARGQFTVIYDAEDRPEPTQLKRVVAAFRRAPNDLACLQAKLNYYNRDQNMLTRWFTTEYSMWFDLLLPGLDNTGAPIPLGGTSNHFNTERLRAVGGWDPFNVTEDADLGIRMFKHGFRTAIVDSTTYEEATSDMGNWIRQRTRWVKGYMQTWLVHMRHPLQLWRSVGFKAMFSFQCTVGGTPYVFLMNPIAWTLTTIWFLSRWAVIPPLFPGPVYYLSAANALLGNFIFVYLNLVGSYERGYYELSRSALISPFYWALMSIASWRALWHLVTRPFYWEKTTHGRHDHGGPAAVGTLETQGAGRGETV